MNVVNGGANTDTRTRLDLDMAFFNGQVCGHIDIVSALDADVETKALILSAGGGYDLATAREMVLKYCEC